MDSPWELVLAILVPLSAALLGYWLGLVRVFYEAKVKAHEGLITPLLRVAFQQHARSREDVETVNQALARSWILANRRTALAVDELAGLLKTLPREEFLAAAQAAIIAIRRDAHPPLLRWLQGLRPKDVKHFQFAEGDRP